MQILKKYVKFRLNDRNFSANVIGHMKLENVTEVNYR